MNWIVRKLLERKVNTMNLGTNWKGKAGGVGAMLTALAGLLGDVASGNFSVEKAMGYVSVFSLGLAAFGIRSAIGPK